MPSDSTPPAPWQGESEPAWLTRVRASFTEHLDPRMEAVGAARAEVAETGRLSDATRAELFRNAHAIAGTAASVGGERLGAIAGTVARRVDPRKTDGAATREGPAAGGAGDLDAMLDEFEAAAAEFLSWAE